MVADFWSMALLINELGTIYAAQAKLASIDFAAVARLPRLFSIAKAEILAGREGERLLAYWQKQLSEAQTVLNLPASRPRPQVQTYVGANEHFRLNNEITTELKQLAQDCNSTLFTTLLAAFQVLLYRHTGQDDFLVGSPDRRAVVLPRSVQ